MRDLIRMLFIALLAYGLYTLFMAREMDEPDPLEESGTATRCLQRLDRAGDKAQTAIRRFSTSPVDLDGWQGTYESLDQQLSVAGAACNCSGESCTRGRKALGKLRSLVVAMHDEHTTSKSPLADAPQRLDQFRREWEAAKALDR